MKSIYIKIIMVMLAVGALSCSEDFLELTPQQSVADTDALTNLEDYKSSITSVYNDLSSANYYGRYFVLIPDVMSDDVKQNSQANRVKEYAEYVATESNGNALAMWGLMYSAVLATNNIINADITVPDAVLDDQRHIVGEAHALRGQIYFDMVRLWGQHYTFTPDASHLGVPIVLDFDPTSEPSRNTVEQVYEQVISDMTTALTLMSDESRSGTSSTLSSTAVKALLARVYLYKEDWENAEIMASEVIASGEYSLVSNASYISSWASDHSSESIFEISMTESDNRGSDALGRMYMVEGYGDYLPSDDVVSLYPAGDVRLGNFIPDPLLADDFAPFRMNKYPTVSSEDNTKVMRLSEVYLIRAEARAEQDKDTEAQGDVDVIRQRGLSTAPDVTETGQALKDEIALERRLELCFEGQRLWDLMRKKQNVVRNQCTSEVCLISYPSNRVVLPIPEAERDANPNVEPNPGF